MPEKRQKSKTSALLFRLVPIQPEVGDTRGHPFGKAADSFREGDDWRSACRRSAYRSLPEGRCFLMKLEQCIGVGRHPARRPHLSFRHGAHARDRSGRVSPPPPLDSVPGGDGERWRCRTNDHAGMAHIAPCLKVHHGDTGHPASSCAQFTNRRNSLTPICQKAGSFASTPNVASRSPGAWLPPASSRAM